MSTFDIVAAFFMIIGFLAVLFGVAVVINAIVQDALRALDKESEVRRRGRRVDHLSGRPEFFRPRYARNRRV